MRKRETVLEVEALANLPSLPVMDSTTSIVQDKIIVRRKHVHELYLQGYTNKQIAKKIRRDLSTVEKDLHAIRELSRQWYEKESIIDYCKSVNDGIILCNVVIEELWLLYREETNSEMKTKILSLISSNEDKKLQLYKDTSIVKRFLGKNQEVLCK